MIRIGLLTIHLYIPGCTSLKEKRSTIKPIVLRLHKEFNVSSSEIDLLDRWQESILACVIVSNNKTHNEQSLQKIVRYTEKTWPDVYILDHTIEMI